MAKRKPSADDHTALQRDALNACRREGLSDSMAGFIVRILVHDRKQQAKLQTKQMQLAQKFVDDFRMWAR